MMESNTENQNELLQQLQKLRAEKELLEKQVIVLNECLSVDELKSKISNLEKKKEMLLSLENMIRKLRVEIEPLKYLKSILENKLINENQTNVTDESYIDLKQNVSKLNIELNNIKTECKTQQTQNTSVDSTKTVLVQSQILQDEILDTKQTTTSNSNSMSIINDGSIDECVQLLDQYDVVTDQEIVNFSNESFSDIQDVGQDSVTSIIDNIDNGIQDNKTVLTNSNVNDMNTQLTNEDSVPVKKEVDLIESFISSLFSSKNNLVNSGASTSQSDQSKNSLHSESNVSIADLILRIPQLLLKQEINSNKSFSDIQDVGQDLITSIIDNIDNGIQDNKTVLTNSNVNDMNTQLTNEDSVPVKDEEKSKVSFNNISTNEHAEHNKVIDKERDLETLNKENTDHNESIEPNDEINLEINTFNDMDLKLNVLRGIYSLGLLRPTNLQERVIPHIINGRDMVVFGRPGNGRTIMFVIPLLQRIKTNFNDCQALVLVPTMKLASDIQKIIISVGEFLDINVCIGGDNVPKKLCVVPHVMVGTPAKVSSMIAWNSLNIGFINTIVLYKVDQMLDFKNTKLVKGILEKIKTKQVTLLASEKLDHVLDTHVDSLNDPLIIIDEKEKYNERNSLIKDFPKQFYLDIQEDWKINALCEIIETLKIKRGIIFCNTMTKANSLFNYLQDLKYAVAIINMELNGSLSEKNLYNLHSNELKIIITTDPVRGSPFTQVTWLINYDFPDKASFYLNRISHCKGNIKVLNLINENDRQNKINIESSYNFQMIQVPLNMADLLQF